MRGLLGGKCYHPPRSSRQALWHGRIVSGGSTLTMPRAVKIYAEAIGNQQLALRAAIENPLRAYGLKPASLQPEEAAILVLWDKELNLIKTFNL
jgi:N-acetylglucosamine-6-phosphate deacetylase